MNNRPKLPSWVLTSYGDALQETPTLQLEQFLKEYLTVDDAGEWRLKKRPIFRCAWPIEKNKFGREDQQDLFDSLDEENRELVERHRIGVIGLDVSAEMHAVFTAIQKLLEETNYKGNMPKRKDLAHPSDLPKLYVSPTKYYEAYGVKRVRTKRGKNELIGWETKKAHRALHDTSGKRFLFWEEITNSDGAREIIASVRPAFNVSERYRDLTEPEKRHLVERFLVHLVGDDVKTPEWIAKREQLDNNAPHHKLSGLIIEPTYFFVANIKKRFVCKELNYCEEVRQLAGNKPKYPLLFIDLLLLDASQKFVVERSGKQVPWVFKRRLKKLAHELRMNSWINARSWTQIRRAVKRCLRIAYDLGYLRVQPEIEQRPDGEMVICHMNRDKFLGNLELEGKRGQYEERIRKAEKNARVSVPPILAGRKVKKLYTPRPDVAAKPAPAVAEPERPQVEKRAERKEEEPPKRLTPEDVERRREELRAQLRRLAADNGENDSAGE